MADEKKTVILDFEVDADDATVSIQKLTAANKALREERKKVDISTEEGIKRIKDINKAIDDNDKVIKNNSSSLEKQRLNVGNYTGALDKLIPGLGATAEGFIGVGKSITTALVANPVGAIIAGIVAAIGLLIKAFTGTEAGGDLLAKRMDQLGAIFNVIMDRAGALGGALVKLFTGDFIGAANDASAAVSGVGDEMAREVKIAGELADILDELGNRELDYKVAASGTELQIKKLILESKNRLLTEDQKIKKLKEANDLEVKQNEIIKKINQDKLSVAIQQLEMNNSQLNLQREKDESELEYAERLAATREVKFEDLEKLGEAIIELNKTEGESVNLQEKLSNMIDAQNLKQEEKKKKIEEVKQKQDELLKKETELIDKRLEKSNALEAKLDEQRAAREKKEDDSNAKISMSNAMLYLSKTNAAINLEDTKRKLREQDEKEQQEQNQKIVKGLQDSLNLAADITAKFFSLKQEQYKNEEKALAASLAEQKKILNDQYAADVAALDEKLKKGLISQADYDKGIIALNEKQKAEMKKLEIDNAKALNDIKKKQFETDKKNQIAAAVADVAKAVLGVFAATAGGIVIKTAAALVAAAYGAIRVKQISEQQFVPTTFRKGGYTGDGDPNQLAGQTHKGEFVMPAETVTKYGKDFFQSFMDGSVVANGMTGGMKSASQSMAPVYLNYTEFKKFTNEVQLKETITSA